MVGFAYSIYVYMYSLPVGFKNFGFGLCVDFIILIRYIESNTR